MIKLGEKIKSLRKETPLKKFNNNKLAEIEINKFERDTLSTMPIMISGQAMELDEEKMKKLTEKYTEKI